MGTVYWLLRGDRSVPSSRLQGYNIHHYLRRQGIQSVLLFEPLAEMRRSPLGVFSTQLLSRILRVDDVLILQKPHDRSAVWIDKIRNAISAKILMIDCDFPVKPHIGRSADRVVCPSIYLCDRYRERGVVHVSCIPDAPEKFIPPATKRSNTILTCVWFGRGGKKKWRDVVCLRKILGDPRLEKWQLITISNWPDADYPWSDRAYELISQADAVVVPSFANDDWALSKSANRVLQSMALGVPVLASPIPSYKETIVNGINGFLCENENDWIENLVCLTDETRRRQMSQTAYEYVSQRFSLAEIGPIWIDTLEKMGFTAHARTIQDPVTEFRIHGFRTIVAWRLFRNGRRHRMGYFRYALRQSLKTALSAGMLAISKPWDTPKSKTT